MEDMDRRLNEAVKLRASLLAEVQRIEGQLEAARGNLRIVEDECRTRWIDPDQIEITIEQLSNRYKALVEQLECDLKVVEVALAPYVKEK